MRPPAISDILQPTIFSVGPPAVPVRMIATQGDLWPALTNLILLAVIRLCERQGHRLVAETQHNLLLADLDDRPAVQLSPLDQSYVVLAPNSLATVGDVFKVHNNEHDRTELIVFISPKVVWNQSDARDATDEVRTKMQAIYGRPR